MSPVTPRIIAILASLIAFLALNASITHDLQGKTHLPDPHHLSIFAWADWVFNRYDQAPIAFNIAWLEFFIGTALILVLAVFYVGMVVRSAVKHDESHGSAHFASREEVMAMGLALFPLTRIEAFKLWLKAALFRKPPPPQKPSDGVYCGAYEDQKSRKTLYLRHNGPEHICALAPTRSGKGVGLVIPTLLSWEHSTFVLDFKGENWAITSGWRSRSKQGGGPGNRCLRFDPAEITSDPALACCWNPLDEIRFETAYQVADSQNIALMVVDDDGKGIAGNHFRSAAFELINGLILHALYKAKRLNAERIETEAPIFASLATVAQMLVGAGPLKVIVPPPPLPTAQKLSPPKKPPEDAIGEALKALWAEMQTVQLEVGAGRRSEAAGEAQIVIQSVGTRMANTPAKELGSIVSTANNALMLYRDPIVARNTARSTFCIAPKEADPAALPSLMDSELPLSLYLVIAPNNIDRMRPLMRLLLTQIVLRLANKMNFEGGRAVAPHKHRLLLLLDEFPVLGKLDVFESALAYIAGYQMKAYIIMQDVQQLFKHYTTNESIISNCHIRIAYAPNKVETAEWISKMAGQTTSIKKHVQESGKRFGMLLEQVSTSYQEHQRALMTPDEVMRLKGPEKETRTDSEGKTLDLIRKSGDLLVFIAGQPVIRGQQILYFRDPTFRQRAAIGPYSGPPDGKQTSSDPIGPPSKILSERVKYLQSLSSRIPPPREEAE